MCNNTEMTLQKKFVDDYLQAAYTIEVEGKRVVDMTHLELLASLAYVKLSADIRIAEDGLHVQARNKVIADLQRQLRDERAGIARLVKLKLIIWTGSFLAGLVLGYAAL